MDSGSGHDLISAKKIDRMDLPTYDDTVVNFHTANVVTSSTKRSDIKFEAFDEHAISNVDGETLCGPWLLIHMAIREDSIHA